MRRLGQGEVVIASDGAGSWRPCVLTGGRSDVVLAPSGDIVHEERAAPRITVAFSLVKGERSEWAAAKLTELGIDRIVPLVCERTVVRPQPGAGKRRGERLERIVRESAMQARLAFLPEVTEAVAFREMLAAHDPGTLCIAEPGGPSPGLDRPAVLVGPEGGWSEGELDAVSALGIGHVGLSSSVLRSETAAVVAGALLGALRAGLLAGAPGS